VVSRSGETWSPKNSSSSPVLTITLSRGCPATRTRPRRNLAAPTPPASVVIGLVGWGRSRGDRPRAIGSLLPVELLVKRAALDRNPAHRARLFFDYIDWDELAGIAAGLGRDALLHQRAREVVASGLQRERGEFDAELHPRGLQIVDLPAQEQARGRVHLEVQRPLGRRLRDQPLAEEHGVLVDEAQRHK